MTAQQLSTFLAFQGIETDDTEAEQPLPVVVPWETLDADTYQHELTLLCDWAAWLIDLYEIGQDTIPDCWPLHPAMREELGHLRTAWLLTRHPNTRVGAIGVEWDRHRDITLARIRPITERLGCSSSAGHREPSFTRRWTPNPNQLAAHLDTERAWRDSSGITLARQQAARRVLQDAELRADAADAITARHSNPDIAATELTNQTRAAAANAADAGAADAHTTAETIRSDRHLTQLATAREAAIAALETADYNARGEQWAAALETAAPATEAIADAITRRTRRANTTTGTASRFPDIDNLLGHETSGG